uniref:C-type lectin domain-containing protein n=1 Tax=Steinernema glaseri TaxID=37863 RepID=A0A1I7ZM89_9BILA
MEPSFAAACPEAPTCPPCPECPVVTPQPCPEVTQCPTCPTDRPTTTTTTEVPTTEPTTTTTTTTTTTEAPTTTTTLATTTTPPATCPFRSHRRPIYAKNPSWSWFGLSRYAYFSGHKNFTDAEATCAYFDAHLASIHGWSERRFVATMVPSRERGNNNVWLGAVSSGNDEYCWTDHSNWDYKSLVDGASQKRHCISIYYPTQSWYLTYEVVHSPCEQEFGFICKKPVF